MTPDTNTDGAILTLSELQIVFHYLNTIRRDSGMGTAGRTLGSQIAAHLHLPDVFARVAPEDTTPVVVEDTEEDE